MWDLQDVVHVLLEATDTLSVKYLGYFSIEAARDFYRRCLQHRTAGQNKTTSEFSLSKFNKDYEDCVS
jgi:hypothetical protein